MRIFLILTVLFTGTVALADDPKTEEVDQPKDCTSCTARHKSLQALQQARTSSGSAEPEKDKQDE